MRPLHRFEKKNVSQALVTMNRSRCKAIVCAAALILDLVGVAGMVSATTIGGPLNLADEGMFFVYEAHADLHGIYYCSSMDGNRLAIALTDWAETLAPLADHPDFNRPLADDALLDMLKHSAHELGYGLL